MCFVQSVFAFSHYACVLQLVMNVPFTAIHFATYESCKKLLAMEEDESLAVQLAAGGMAGGVSAALTTPLDVVKTRLQLEGVNSHTRYRTTAVVGSLTYVAPSVLQLLLHELSTAFGSFAFLAVWHLVSDTACCGHD